MKSVSVELDGGYAVVVGGEGAVGVGRDGGGRGAWALRAAGGVSMFPNIEWFVVTHLEHMRSMLRQSAPQLSFGFAA